ncbi:hypothetical protein QYE76_030406 [Lolium multiflorum]|uniref:Uncharacterized protein n=1 Tax=Lolium multiflorum TaxID=4521 RepID=A0AAD8QT92_LOLMU|nr:hypothetical protein QYE76_030406 [Lolium multiflorum]
MAYEAPQVFGGGAGVVQMQVQQLFLDAGRVSVLGGWVVVTYSFGNPVADATHVFLGFALLLLGVLLLTLSPAASQFPWVARLSAVVANAVLNDLFEPGNY